MKHAERDTVRERPFELEELLDRPRLRSLADTDPARRATVEEQLAARDAEDAGGTSGAADRAERMFRELADALNVVLREPTSRAQRAVESLFGRIADEIASVTDVSERIAILERKLDEMRSERIAALERKLDEMSRGGSRRSSALTGEREQRAATQPESSRRVPKTVTVRKQESGWEVVAAGKGASRTTHDTQRKAVEFARGLAKGMRGELVIHDQHGNVRDRRSYAPSAGGNGGSHRASRAGRRVKA